MKYDEQYKKDYYDNFAPQFDAHNINADDEHYLALAALEGLIDYLGIGSALDVGSGTGRALLYLGEKKPSLRVHGIEPSDGMRARAVEKGVPLSILTAGGGTDLPFKDGEFDLVMSYGVLHHIREADKAVAEMMRVAKKAVFISDANYMGQGPMPARLLKWGLTKLGLWQAAYKVYTGGKGYWTSPHDGLAYSFSVHNYRKLLMTRCDRIHYLSTMSSTPNLTLGCSHLAILALKKEG
ncbi:MAG: methyltransferase type 11 [Verrucomicrobiaceae bacterium]|nr:methyltransferase type 11 [Verrucomicrobiaceae bacterium]